MAEETPDPGPDTPPVVSGPGDGDQEPARTGWYRSPSGHPAHADGPDQQRAYADRGWTPISEAEAKNIVAAGATLIVDRSDAKGTFDDDAVKAAVRNESTTRRPRARRSGS